MIGKTVTALALTTALIAFTGCKDPANSAKTPPSATTKKPDGDHHDDHDHGPGPHKGTIGEFGGKHIEFVVDHANKQATVYILAADAKTAFPIKAESIKLSIKEPEFTIDLKASPQPSDPPGKASRFVGTDDRFGKEQEFSGEVDAVDLSADPPKPYHGEFQEKPEKK